MPRERATTRPAELALAEPVQRPPGKARPVKHGARSEPVVRRVATVQKRRLLRQAGLRASDMDGIGLALLDGWARAQSKVELMDSWTAEHGWLDDAGNPPGFTPVYFAALNSARLALGKLAEHLKVRPGTDGVQALILEGRLIRERRSARDAVEPLAIEEGGES